VRLALQYLDKEYGVGGKYKWIGVGHSCGATLLAQLVADMAPLPSEETRDGVGIARRGPSSLLLIAGIYDLRLMLANHQPPGCPVHIAQIYKDFVQGAFGKDTSDAEFYDSVSPTHGAYVPEVCPSVKEVVLAYSPDDELIEPQQREVMVARLMLCGWVERGQKGERVVEVKDLTDGHDEVWQDGRQVAGLIGEAVGRMFGA
jgi:kynurenine formamidase